MIPWTVPCPWNSPGKNTGVGCHFLLQCMKVKSESEGAQSCPTLRDPMDRSPPGSSIHGISQARVLEWDAIAFSLHSLQLWPKWGRIVSGLQETREADRKTASRHPSTKQRTSVKKKQIRKCSCDGSSQDCLTTLQEDRTHSTAPRLRPGGSRSDCTAHQDTGKFTRTPGWGRGSTDATYYYF